MYRVCLTRTAESTYVWLQRHNRKLFARIQAVLETLALNPFVGKALKWDLKGKYSYRVGPYRIIYAVMKERLVVYVLDIGHLDRRHLLWVSADRLPVGHRREAYR